MHLILFIICISFCLLKVVKKKKNFYTKCRDTNISRENANYQIRKLHDVERSLSKRNCKKVVWIFTNTPVYAFLPPLALALIATCSYSTLCVCACLTMDVLFSHFQLFGGFLIALDSLPGWIRWMKYLSLFRYSVEVKRCTSLKWFPFLSHWYLITFQWMLLIVWLDSISSL